MPAQIASIPLKVLHTTLHIIYYQHNADSSAVYWFISFQSNTDPSIYVAVNGYIIRFSRESLIFFLVYSSIDITILNFIISLWRGFHVPSIKLQFDCNLRFQVQFILLLFGWQASLFAILYHQFYVQLKIDSMHFWLSIDFFEFTSFLE